MRRLRRVCHEQGARLADTALPCFSSERRCTRHQHRHQIGHRCAGDENAARARREAEHLAGPFDDLPFDLDRHMVAAAEIGVEPGRQHFREHADGRAAAMHPAHEARMHVAGRIGHDEVGEHAIDVAEIGRLLRKLLAKLRPHRIGNRLPDWTLADRCDVVDHVIEHAMTLGAEFVPVLRIERLARLGRQRRVMARHGHAACSRLSAACRTSMAAKASKILRICGGL